MYSSKAKPDHQHRFPSVPRPKSTVERQIGSITLQSLLRTAVRDTVERARRSRVVDPVVLCYRLPLVRSR